MEKELDMDFRILQKIRQQDAFETRNNRNMQGIQFFSIRYKAQIWNEAELA
jgi:hypothetical protein